MKTLYFVLILSFLSIARAFSSDLSLQFDEAYKSNVPLTLQEQQSLKDYNFYLIPGILSESFLREDTRSHFNFSCFTKDYFGGQLRTLDKKYKFATKQLSSSSSSVDEIRKNIRDGIEEAIKENRKSFFITHSLGGLALLEELVFNEHYQEAVAGIIFLQSPFHGTPVADIFLKYPFQSKFWLKPLLPIINTSEETIQYMSPMNRLLFMSAEKENILKLIHKIPVITVGGVVNGYKSLFSPSIYFQKKYGFTGESDGMVPFESSLLESVDFIKLQGVDHGELVVRIPYSNFKQEDLTESLLRLMLPRLKNKLDL
jgi:triacylglycerol lipase